MLSRFTVHERIMLVGAALIALGVFMPLASLPMIGSFNYMARGRGDGMIVLLLAVVIAGLVFFRFRLVAATVGLAVAAIMATTLITLLNTFHDMDVKAAELAKENMFGTLAVAFARNSGLEWGWFLLFAGVLMVIGAGFTAPRGAKRLPSSTEPSPFDPDAIVSRYIAGKRLAEASRPDERRAQFGQAKSPLGNSPGVAAASPTWSWGDVLFWAALVICGLIFLGAVGQIVDPKEAEAKKEGGDAKKTEAPAQKTQSKQTVIKDKPASSFSNHVAVDNVRLSEGSDYTIAIVTVRIPTKLESVKCAAIEGSQYLGVGSIVNASPPAEDVYVTLPGTGYGSSVRAECSFE